MVTADSPCRDANLESTEHTSWPSPQAREWWKGARTKASERKRQGCVLAGDHINKMRTAKYEA